jgi:hypothetical protein
MDIHCKSILANLMFVFFASQCSLLQMGLKTHMSVSGELFCQRPLRYFIVSNTGEPDTGMPPRLVGPQKHAWG